PCSGGVKIADPLPMGVLTPSLPLTTGTTIPFSCQAAPPNTILCSTPNLFAPGQTSMVTIPYAALVPGVLPNCATLKSPGDMNPANNVSGSGAQICAMKFNDLNMDGTRQNNEPFMAGFTFNISPPGTPASKTTDASGTACFDLPVPGTYT